MTPALVAAAVVSGLVLVILARLVVLLDEAELTLRRLVTGVRAARRAATGATGFAATVGRDVTAGGAALSVLEELRRSGRPAPVASGEANPPDRVSMVIRPHTVPPRPGPDA